MPRLRAGSHNVEARSLVAERLRALRAERGLTLSAMSQRSGVSVSNLSKIERGDISPSVDVIFRICESLDLPLEQFLKPGPKATISGCKTITHLGETVPFASGQYDYLAHATELSRKAMVPLELRVRARAPEDFDEWSRHEGEEFVFVIEGTIDVYTEFYSPFRLKAGESTYFDSGMRHIYVSVGAKDARVLSVSHGATLSSASLTSFMQPDAAAKVDAVDMDRSAPAAAPRADKMKRRR